MGIASWGSFTFVENHSLPGEPRTAAGAGTAQPWPEHCRGTNIWWETAFNVHCLASGVASGQHWLLELSEGKVPGCCWGLEVTAVGWPGAHRI